MVASRVSSAFDEANQRHTRKPKKIFSREDERVFYETVNEKFVPLRVDLWNPRVMALKMESGRSDDSVKILQRRPAWRLFLESRTAGSIVRMFRKETVPHNYDVQRPSPAETELDSRLRRQLPCRLRPETLFGKLFGASSVPPGYIHRTLTMFDG